jgi:hypothetical protein
VTPLPAGGDLPDFQAIAVKKDFLETLTPPEMSTMSRH